MSEGGGPAPLYRHNTLMDVKSQKRSFALLHFKPGLGSCGSSASAVHSTSALLLQWAHTGTLQVGDHNHVSRKYVHVRKKSNCIGARTLSQVLGLCWEQRGAWRPGHGALHFASAQILSCPSHILCEEQYFPTCCAFVS